MIKYCRTCCLRNEAQKACQLTGVPIDLDTDFCSKHMEEPRTCSLCGGVLIGETFLVETAEGEWNEYCARCNALFNTCQMCPKFQVCEFLTNPDPMPKVVMKTVRQGNMVMQMQVKNEERAQKFCPSCGCWDENHGCMKEFNIGCVNRPDFYNTRESSEN